MHEIRMPKIGLGDETVTILSWLVEVGASIAVGDPIAEVETDKATMTVEAPSTGTLASRLVQPGDSVSTGQLIGVLTAPGEVVEDQNDQRIERSNTSPDRARHVIRSPMADGTVPEHIAVTKLTMQIGAGELRGFPPKVPGRSHATHVVDTVSELLPPGNYREQTLDRRRTSIARRMTASATIPQFTVLSEVIMDSALKNLDSLRKQYRQVSLTDLLVCATTAALTANPKVNSLLLDDRQLVFADAAIALAVDTQHGVVAPVLKDVVVDAPYRVSEQRLDLTNRARRNELRASELSGATFTISNIGPLGADCVIPLLTPPQVAAIGVGRVKLAQNGINVMTVAFVGDHRVLDGADGARFLTSLGQELARAGIPSNDQKEG